MHLAPRASASSGWLPAAILGLLASGIVAAYGVPITQVTVFGAYVIFGLVLPGTLWVRLLRGRAALFAEDLTLGLCLGYCMEIAAYVVARAASTPLLFLVWPIATIVAFAAIPRLRSYWRGSGERAPLWWAWSIAVLLGFVLVYSAVTFFATHHLTGTDTPYVDMPYHLALIGELRHHVPPDFPYVAGQPLAYHWFFYAEAAATSWATGIEPVTLLYRLSGLPMFVAFVVLTAAAARRLTGGWWAGPLAAALALFATVAEPYRWVGGPPVFDAQTMDVTWISPTNLFGLALFAATLLVFIDLLHTDIGATRRGWLLATVLVLGCAGAKASLVPLLIVGFLIVLGGVAIHRRRPHRAAAVGFALSVVALGLAAVLIFRGATGGLVVGLNALRAFPLVRAASAADASGLAGVIVPIAAWLVALALWSFLWAGAFGLLVSGSRRLADPRLLLLVGICAGALGAVTVFDYPGSSQVYFLKSAAGAFALLTASGIAAVAAALPDRASFRPLITSVVGTAVVGAVSVLAIAALGPRAAPNLSTAHLSGVLPAMILPVLGLVGIAVIGYVVLARMEVRWPVVVGGTPLLLIALVMGFSIPGVRAVLASPIGGGDVSAPVPADGIAAARWLRDHSGPDDVVATNLHCRDATQLASAPGACDARHFWVSAYAERHVLVEGWAYTTRAMSIGRELGTNDRTVPFWDGPLLAANDAAFTDPSPGTLARLRGDYGVRWLFADLALARPDALAQAADLRYQTGDFAVYELRGS